MESKQDRGLIFDIERFSTADGPGIRTVVFFKGCNLSCYWCHNPESIRFQPELELDSSCCIGCGLCYGACGRNAHLWEPSHTIRRDCCVSCFRCSEVCPSGALKQAGTWMDVDACIEQILPDVPFYASSGGGVTLSGGEVLLQAPFAAKLLARCKEAGLSTAMESNLCFSRDRLDALLPWLDLVMADVKHMDPQAHRRGTGQSNAQILENLRYLAQKQVPLILRTPIISGFNDDRENMEQTVCFLKTMESLRYYELLSYNPMGNDKRKRFGYSVPIISTPTRQKMKALAEIAREQNLPVWIDGAVYT